MIPEDYTGKNKMKLGCTKLCHGQSLLEFTFTMVVAVFILMGMLEIFVWVGRDMSYRRQAHEQTLTEPLTGTGAGAPLEQIKPTFYGVTGMDATAPSNIYNYYL